MKYFAGMDVSLEETAICVVDESGRMVKEFRAVSEPDALNAALGSLNLPFERVGLEACSLTAWLHGELTSAGWPAICAHRIFHPVRMVGYDGAVSFSDGG